MSKAEQAQRVAHGVEALIERLRVDGVAAGRDEAQRIINEAEQQAGQILEQARSEAQALRQAARAEAERFERSARDALEVATRDALLALKAQLAERFTGQVQRLVAESLHTPEVLERMILEVAGRERPLVDGAARVEILLPREVIDLEALSRHPEQGENDPITELVRAVNQDLLREGVIFGEAEGEQHGLRLRLTDEGVVLDLTDRAIAEVLLAHLQPRFRALLDGIVT